MMIFPLLAIVAPVSVSVPASTPVTETVAETIVVRAERLREQNPTGQRLDGPLLQNQAGVRLDEALRVVPGLGLFRRTPSGPANATIQGLSLRPIAPNGAGRALVSLDGVPQNDPFGGWIYWGRYDPLFLEQVTSKSGGAGAGFGPMALTGTLDLTQARGQKRGLAISAGSFNSRHIAGRQSWISDGAIFTAMGSYEQSGGAFSVSKAQRGPVDRPIDFQFSSLELVTDIARDNGSWSFRGAGFSEAKGAGLVGGQSSAYGLDVSAARRFDNALGQSRIIIFGQGRDFSNQTVSVTSSITARRARAIPALDQYATPSSALGGSFAFVPRDKIQLPSITIDARRAEGETQERFRFIGNDFTRTRLVGGRQDLIGAGLSLPRPLLFGANRLQLDGTVRLDYWANYDGLRRESDRSSGAITLSEAAKDRSGQEVSGRVSLAQTNGPMRLTLYRTFRPPTLNELHRPFRIGNDVTEANAALMPETLIGADLNLGAASDLFGGRLTSSATFYVNRLNDPIANVTVAAGPGVFARVGFLPAGGSLRERRNVGSIDARGFEANIRWDALNQVLSSVYGGVSWTDAKVDGGATLPQLSGNRPAQAPRWSAIASATLNLTEGLTSSVTVRGEGDRFEDDLNTRKLAAYGALDVRLAWRVNAQSEVFVSTENLFDSKVATAQAVDGIVSLTQQRTMRIGINLRR